MRSTYTFAHGALLPNHGGADVERDKAATGGELQDGEGPLELVGGSHFGVKLLSCDETPETAKPSAADASGRGEGKEVERANGLTALVAETGFGMGTRGGVAPAAVRPSDGPEDDATGRRIHPHGAVMTAEVCLD